jgi:hypothetical protein
MLIHSLGDTAVDVCIMLEDGSDRPSERQLASLESISNLPAIKLTAELMAAARDYCRFIDAKIGLESEGVYIDEQNIDNHYSILEVTVPRLGDCDIDFALLGMACDWEEEHGMHALLSNGRVAYCGSCATVFYGAGWKQVISANGKESQIARLNELLAAIPR